MIKLKASKRKGMIWLEQFQGDKHVGTCGFDYKNAGKVTQKILHHQGVYWGESQEKLDKAEISSLLEQIGRAYRAIYNHYETMLSVEPNYVETAGIWVIKIANVHEKMLILLTENMDSFINSIQNTKTLTFADGSHVTLDREKIVELVNNIESANHVVAQMNQPITTSEQDCRATMYSGW